MQPAVDDAVAQQAPGSSFDVTPVADLLALGESEDEHDEHAGDEDEHADDEAATHQDEAADEDDGHDHGAEDPHFWLDPQRYGDVAEALAAELAAVDPDNAQAYTTNAAALVADLLELDEEIAAGLEQCASRQVVTTHDAFGYLGARYDLEVTGITGMAEVARATHTPLSTNMCVTAFDRIPEAFRCGASGFIPTARETPGYLTFIRHAVALSGLEACDEGSRPSRIHADRTGHHGVDFEIVRNAQLLVLYGIVDPGILLVAAPLLIQARGQAVDRLGVDPVLIEQVELPGLRGLRCGKAEQWHGRRKSIYPC